jgi:hypothetical protein
LPPLAAGQYSIDLMLGQPNVPCFDYIEEALVVSVLPGVHAGSGCRTVRQLRHGCVFIQTTPVPSSLGAGSTGGP